MLVCAFSTYHQVLLDVLIDSVEGGFSVHHVQLGFFVSAGPSLKLAGADVLVTQAERPQGLIGKDLQDKIHQCPSCQSSCWCLSSEAATHIQSGLGGFLVSGVWGQALIDDRVGSFTVQTNSSVRKLH